MSPHKILVVDDEIANLQKLRRTFVHRYEVLAASRGAEALELVERNGDIAVIVADQRMPDMSGVEFLRRTLDPLPHAIRIILTGYTDIDVLIEAINSCKVYRYIVKPWDPHDLLMTVERGLEAFQLALENERFRKELIRRERLAHELEIAREIQRYILPPSCPGLEGYRMDVEYHPAREVGGDLYDFDWDPVSHSLQVIIGDVSGKSIPAALYGAVFSGQMRSLFAQSMSPAEILSFLNRSLLERYPAGNYIAVACLRLDLLEGRGLLANGGMPFPYLVRGGRPAQVQAAGIPLGLMEVHDYSQTEVCLEKGDALVLVSDGIADALNPRNEMYGFERLADSIARHVRGIDAGCVSALYRDVFDFIRNAEAHDDITIIGLQRFA